MSASFRIVILCGSSGALSPYIEILRSVRQDSGMTFVVLTHRRSNQPCHLVKILSAATRMHVEEIEDGTKLEPSRVYVIPAGKDLTTDGTVFWLAPISKTRGWPDGFDIFLKSVARNTRGRAITVVLSGLAADGSAALVDLRASGGTSFAQDDAEHRSMPTNAIATGYVDHIGSAAEIAAMLSDLPSSPS